MDKLKLTGQNLGRVFKVRRGLGCLCNGIALTTKQPNLRLKTRRIPLLGFLPIAFVLPSYSWQVLVIKWSHYYQQAPHHLA